MTRMQAGCRRLRHHYAPYTHTVHYMPYTVHRTRNTVQSRLPSDVRGTVRPRQERTCLSSTGGPQLACLLSPCKTSNKQAHWYRHAASKDRSLCPGLGSEQLLTGGPEASRPCIPVLSRPITPGLRAGRRRRGCSGTGLLPLACRRWRRWGRRRRRRGRRGRRRLGVLNPVA